MDISKIGEKIKQKRLEENITQKELASKMNISSQLVSKWETNESVPLLEYIEKLCEVFNVDISYFVGSSAKSKKQINIPKWAWGVIGSVAGAIIIVTFILLCVFVFFPSKPTTPPNKEDEYLKYRETYLTKLSDSAENTLNLNFYNIESTSYLDGDEVKKHIWQGYLDNENIVSYVKTINKKDNEEIIEKEETIKDNIKSTEALKYDYTKPSNIHTLKDMYKHFVSIEEADKTYDITEEDITYIKPTSTGYYIELKDEVFFNLFETNAAKKNLKLNDKIKLEITIKNNCIETINITIKYRNTKENEDFESKSTTKYFSTKPEIDHTSLDEKIWNIELPVLEEGEFINTAFNGKAQKVDNKHNEILYDICQKYYYAYYTRNYSNGNYYLLNDTTNQLTIINFDDLNNNTTIQLLENTSILKNTVNIYNNDIYFLRYIEDKSNEYKYVLNKQNISTGEATYVTSFKDISDFNFNGRYIYFKFSSTSSTKSGVYNLVTQKFVFSSNDFYITFVDSNGNIYYDNNSKTYIYGTDISFESGCSIYEKNGSVYARTKDYENFTIYKFENNTLVETIDTVLLKKQLKNDIKYVNINNKGNSPYFLKFVSEFYEINGNYFLSFDSDETICYSKNDLSRPICITNENYSNYKIRKIDNYFIICVYQEDGESYNYYMLPIE